MFFVKNKGRVSPCRIAVVVSAFTVMWAASATVQAFGPKTDKPLPTVTLTVTPTGIQLGDAATLQWNSTDSNRVYLDGIKVSASGSQSVSPQSMTTYTLMAYGPGLWTDIENRYALYEYNQTSHNKVAGIFHEISYDAVIRYNTIENDAYAGDPTKVSFWYGAGILICHSSNVEVYGNTVTNCMNAIGGVYGNRGNGSDGQPYVLENLNVHDNAVTQGTGFAEGIVRDGTFDNSVYTSMNNHIQNDTYSLSDPNGKYFVWLGGLWTLAQWE